MNGSLFVSNKNQALLPFNYVLIMALSYCGFWLLNMLLLNLIEGGFVTTALTSLAITALLWLPWLRMYMQSDRPDKRIMKPLFPRYFWSSLFGSTLLLVTVLVFIGSQFGLEDKVNLIQHPALLVTALHFVWFWRWWFKLFYHYDEPE